MSRHAKSSESPAPSFRDDLYEASPPPSRQRQRQRESTAVAQDSPSPATSISSDKENHSSRVALNKGKGPTPMGPPRVPSPDGNKRKRLSEPDLSKDRSRRRKTLEVEEDESDVEYDPDQDIEVRRKLRKDIRDLGKNLTDNRAEYLTANSTGLRDTLIRANELSNRVKQTSDATIDSRLLVQAADLSYKKTVALTSGDTAQGIDIEDFLSRLKQFMRRGNVAENASSTQRRRGNVEEDDEDGDGEMLDWEYLGHQACVKHTLRPSVPGFLLGPLSLEKRARRVAVRKAALRPNTIKETRPEVLQADDIEKDENKNLTNLCAKILTTMNKYTQKSMEIIEAQDVENLTTAQQDEILDRYGISRQGGVALFKFVINPRSFGQTIENMFYTSFLIRDGKLGISVDDRGLPYLDSTEPLSGAGNAHNGPSKHQAVLALDMATWEELIDAFDITEPIIEHREEESHSNVGAKGWYA